jgi:hypothetical protein
MSNVCWPLERSSCPANLTCVNTVMQTSGTCTAYGSTAELQVCDFGFSNGGCVRDTVCLQDSGTNPPPPQCFRYCDPTSMADQCSQETLCVGTLVDVDSSALRFCARLSNCDFFSPPAGCTTSRPCCGASQRCEPLSVTPSGFVKSECVPAGLGGAGADCASAADPNMPDGTKCQAGFLCISFGSQSSCSSDAQCTMPQERCIDQHCSRSPSCRPVCDPASSRAPCGPGMGACTSNATFFAGKIGVCL